MLTGGDVNDNLVFRNTFVWDPYQFQQAGGASTAAPSVGFTTTELLPVGKPWRAQSCTFRLHADASQTLRASRSLESIKDPDDNRVLVLIMPPADYQPNVEGWVAAQRISQP